MYMRVYARCGVHDNKNNNRESGMKILVIEDDALLGDFIVKCLRASGFDTTLIDDGLKGYKRATKGAFDAIVLDINLPSMNGIEVCQKLRSDDVSTPVLFLSSMHTTHDRVRGLEVGADDYLVKPFEHDELVARVRALSRRPSNYVEQVIMHGELTIDTAKRSVVINGKNIKLTPKEFQLLELLARNPGMVLSREYLLSHIWGVTIGNTSNRLESCIRSLRKKLNIDSTKDIINTEYGVGYKLSK